MARYYKVLGTSSQSEHKKFYTKTHHGGRDGGEAAILGYPHASRGVPRHIAAQPLGSSYSTAGLDPASEFFWGFGGPFFKPP